MEISRGNREEIAASSGKSQGNRGFLGRAAKEISPVSGAVDITLFHALKRCVQGPLLIHFDRVTKQSYMQVVLLMHKQIYEQSPRAKLQVLASMLNTSWKGDVDQWRSDLMERPYGNWKNQVYIS